MLLLNITAAAVLIPIFSVESWNYDTQYHINATKILIKSGIFLYSHFLFHITILSLYKLSNFDLRILAVTAQICFALVYITIGYYWLISLSISSRASGFIIFSSLLYNPISALFFLDNHIYFGYIYSNTFHNPTIWTLRPFAIALFILTTTLVNSHRFSLGTGFASVALATLACMAKPNLTIVLLPAMAVFLIFNKASAGAWRNALWIIVPSLICLAFQYYFSFGKAIDGQGIHWQPLFVMGMFSNHLLIKFLLSIAFPLAVVFLFPDNAFRWQPLQLAWLTFLFSAVMVYSLNETSGVSGGAGNFGWSAQISLLLLFLCSIALLIKERPLAPWRRNLCFAILCLHLIFGLIFYVTELTTRQMQYW